MAIVKEVEYSGNRITSSSDGKVIIDQTQGEIVVRDENNVRRYYIGSKKSPTGFGQYLTTDGKDVFEELEGNA